MPYVFPKDRDAFNAYQRARGKPELDDRFWTHESHWHDFNIELGNGVGGTGWSLPTGSADIARYTANEIGEMTDVEFYYKLPDDSHVFVMTGSEDLDDGDVQLKMSKHRVGVVDRSSFVLANKFVTPFPSHLIGRVVGYHAFHRWNGGVIETRTSWGRLEREHEWGWWTRNLHADEVEYLPFSRRIIHTIMPKGY